MKRILSMIGILSLLVMSFMSCSIESDEGPTLSEKLQEALDNGLESSNGKGVSAAVIMPDGETWVGVSGVSHGTTAIIPNMRFAAGSIGKIFTGTTILQLAEEGKLDLDDPLSRWIPEKYPYVDPRITIRQLLNHTGGLYNFVDNHEWWVSLFSEPERFWAPGDVIIQFNRNSLFPKGTDWNYSNTGYSLLRMMIRRITGMDIPAVSSNRFWIPLGMDSTFTFMGGVLPGNIAHSWYDLDGDGDYDDFFSWSRTAFASGIVGEFFSTAEDLAKWARALFHDRVLLGQPFLDQMLDFHSPCTGEEAMCAGYGLGAVKFNPELFNGLNVIGHSGNAPGFAAASIYLPDYDICLGFLDNTEEGEAMLVINELLHIAIEHIEETVQ